MATGQVIALDGAGPWSYEHFTPREMRCKCGCGLLLISADLVNKLELIRSVYYQTPMIINSGSRCRKWNAHEGGKPKSAHIADPEQNLITTAADISAPTGGARYELIQAAMAVGVNVIGVYRSFVHLEYSPEKAETVFPGGY